jgi:LPS-assembly protein
LVADKIEYSKAVGILIASGNVKVFYEDTVLAAETITYNQQTNEIEIIGPFTLQQGSQTAISGKDAIVNTNLQDGLILGARALINQQLQISAKQLDSVGDKFNVFQTVVASTCEVCENNPTPFWQIRARRIIHDKEQKRLFFENAVLDFLGLPVFYLPSLSIPEPGVTRASGLLVPQFSTSNTLGVTAKIPYYFAIDDHSDATVTPFISVKGSFILEGEYRRRTKNGAYELSGAIALADQLSFGGVSAFIQGQGSFNLKDDYQLNFGLDLANTVDLAGGEKTFRDNFNYSDTEDDRLTNFVNVGKTTSDSYLELGGSFTQSFRYKDFDGDGTREEDPNVPVVLPEFFYRKNYENSILGGKLGLTAQSVTLLNGSSGQYSRIGGRLDWQRYWHSPAGLIFGAASQINGNAYLADNEFFANATPVISLEGRYPLQRTVGNITHVIEPIVQLVWAPDEAFGTLNSDSDTSDSTTAEFEESNLFSINRFPGFDITEAGLRANVGVQYLMHNPKGWEFAATAGRVFREKNLNQFDPSTSTGLNKRNSDYVGAFSLKFPGSFSLLTRLLFDDSLTASKHETKLKFQNEDYKIDFGYVWLDENSILNLDDRQHEVSLETAYRLDQNWTFSADWRHNINTHSPIEGDFGIEYQNECAKVNFSLSLQYDEAGNVDREIGMQISLSGLGAKAKKTKFNRRCGF